MKVAVVDYGSGNLRSAAKALERAARERDVAAEIDVTSDAQSVRRADRVVLPGVGAFADCRHGLESVPGLTEALDEAVRGRGRPFLGICVGMQLMAERGLEYEVSEGLGWVPGEVRRLEPADSELKIPHMGWNTLEPRRDHPLLESLPLGPLGLHAYFVHSFALCATRPEDVLAETDYAGRFPAVVGRDNMVGTQFHPEKSQRLGLALLGNFLAWTP